MSFKNEVKSYAPRKSDVADKGDCPKLQSVYAAKIERRVRRNAKAARKERAALKEEKRFKEASSIMGCAFAAAQSRG